MRSLRLLIATLLTLSAVGVVGIRTARATTDASSADTIVTPRIVNGDAADIASYPWTVAILLAAQPNPSLAQFCGGTLVAPSWVATAAHCTNGRVASQMQVALGRTNLSAISAGDRIAVAQIVQNPSFDPATYDHDVSLLRLSTPATGYAYLPLNTDATAPAAGASVLATGWGSTWPSPLGTTTTTGPQYPDGLRSASMLDAAGPSGTCGLYGPDYVAATMLCAGRDVAGTITDTCSGDSGGPLVAAVSGTLTLVGITSFGNGCAQTDFPGVYTRVSAMASWMQGYIGTPSNQGYRLVATDGGIFTFGDATFLGSTGNIRLNQPIVGMATTPSGNGYWLVASDGGIFTFGDATFHGSTGNIRLNQPIVGMAATPSGNGYWLVATDGGIFTFGDATFRGSTGNIRLNQPIVGMAATPSGNGYWLVATDGGIFTFGDATFRGSTGNIRLNRPIVGMAATPSGNGYWLVATDGGIFSFGDATFLGSTGATRLNQPIVGMAATLSGNGYWLVATDGGIFSFGDAAFLGSTGNIRLNRPIVGMSQAH